MGDTRNSLARTRSSTPRLALEPNSSGQAGHAISQQTS